MAVSGSQIDVDGVLNCFLQGIKRAGNEEELRINVSKCIEDMILKPLGITQYGRYEYTLVSGARVDALYGHVIIEYKAPGKLSTNTDITRAKEQVINYIKTEAASKAEWDRYLGIIISDRIAFVRYYKPQDTWVLRGPYNITRESIIKVIEALRGLRRKALSVDNLLRDFGPQSELAGRVIRALYRRLVESRSPRTRVLFEDWMRLFRQATGYSPDRLEELPQLAREYGLTGNVSYDALIFAIQTYYAFILKLLAAEVVYLYGGGRFYKSYIAELDDAYTRGGVDALRDELRELESGGVFRHFGYENFLEGDYFSWYLEELDKELADALAEVVRRLSDYEPATPQLEPEYARDLLKRLYQQLVPGDIRHNLGEYYTPDWLADFLLDEVGLSLENLMKMGEEDPLKPLQLRVLDPACGSGTFLVRYIARLRAYAREHFLEDVLVDYLLQNVVGYDLNPLAVLTARTNYLLMIADLPKRGTIEIPIYMADSLMVERRSTILGDVYVLKTTAGEFRIPASIVEKNLLPGILHEVTDALRNRYKPEDFKARLKYRFRELEENELNVLVDFYSTLLKLEEEGKDDVWVSIIRNAFAPILRGRFDYVVGNPPWVNWENLPEDFRELSNDLWQHYGLVGRGAGFKRDLAMLFMARCFDLYLKPGGKHAFLMPFTVFKSQAGTGFRRFLATKTKVHVVHDMVSLRPFEEATNETSAIVAEKVCEVNKTCPEMSKVITENMKGVRHVIWVNRTGKPIPTDMHLEDVLKVTERFEAIMTPVVEGDPSSSWMQVTRKALPYIRKVTSGPSSYEAHAGVYTALNQVYFIQIKQRLPDGKLLITNPPEPGQKKRVKQVEVTVEPDLVYPLIRGRDVKKWYVDFSNRYIIIPHYENGEPIPLEELKIKYPLTYGYLYQFKEELKDRGIKPFISLRKMIRSAESKTEKNSALGKLESNFHIVDNIGPYTFAPYRVVWKEVSARKQVGGFHVAVLEPVDDRYLGRKVPIPEHTVILIPFNDAMEAYYVAGILNSTVAAMYGTYMVSSSLSQMLIPKYNADNPLHNEIARLSRKAHELAKCIYSKIKPDYCREVRDPGSELRRVEDELDKAVAQLYGIPEDALEEFRKLLGVLAGEGVPEEG
ncbi:Eco57I restriction-modification methylase domain-containing protein [Vulcanisaeta thermophila]|uniref:Eco57I restriction-modification methylase domain-containing protein n=1 Tax=Vulcanisaeta thermophila TaxID=867917 RepID=UPI000B25448C|nr:class I SAM-dependent DNA methyltransferase [Vulcanisaeta thermophila]